MNTSPAGIADCAAGRATSRIAVVPPRPARLSVAFLSTALPQRCGLATFTADLMAAVGDGPHAVDGHTLAVVGDGAPRRPGLSLARNDPAGYRRAAALLDAAGTDLLCLQHEYGIFGGPDGDLLLDLLDATALPTVATLHTVLEQPSPGQRRVLDRVIARAARVVVMTERAAATVIRLHRARPERVRIVPHGIPMPPPEDRAEARRRLGVAGRPTLLTFGLLSPGKGIEHAVAALPSLVARWPDLLYVVMGATHPNLLRERGETYREGLAAQAAALGVAGNVRFVNRFVDTPELMSALGAADLYLTPYLNEAQSVSGTLAYSYGIGTPVVSTPYHHATELLAGGRGVLVPFADPAALAAAIAGLLQDPARAARMRAAARADGRRMHWPAVGARYLDIFAEVARPRR